MRKVLALLAIALLIPAGLTTVQAAKKKASTSKSATKKAGTGKKGSSRSSAKKGSKRTHGKTQAGQTWRSRQLAPSPERYTDIQQALIQKGYLQGQATGQWDQASTDALRRFQKEQNLEANGKIDSLSLIALGLGPKYDSAAAAPPPRVPDTEKKQD